MIRISNVQFIGAPIIFIKPSASSKFMVETAGVAGMSWKSALVRAQIGSVPTSYDPYGRYRLYLVHLALHPYDTPPAILSPGALSAFLQRLVLAESGKGMRASRCASVYLV